MNIVIINGHPDPESLCSALVKAYIEGAKRQQVEIRTIELSSLQFNPNLQYGYRKRTELEDGLINAQQSIKWADHIVIVSPIWWGTMPAVLKGFFDRVFLPGFAFKYRENSILWDKLLKGKSARLIVTMDTPSWYNRIVYRSAGHIVLKRNILQFCGVNPVKITEFSKVAYSSEDTRKKWIEKARALGEKLG